MNEIVWVIKRSDYRMDMMEKAFDDREDAENYVRSEYPGAELSDEQNRKTRFDRGAMKSIVIKGLEVEKNE